MPTVDPAIARALAEARAQAISEEHLNNVMGSQEWYLPADHPAMQLANSVAQAAAPAGGYVAAPVPGMVATQASGAHYSAPGARAGYEAAGMPPVMHQSNPYATAAFRTTMDPYGNVGVQPLVGFPSQYPHVVNGAVIDPMVREMPGLMPFMQVPVGPALQQATTPVRRAAPAAPVRRTLLRPWCPCGIRGGGDAPRGISAQSVCHGGIPYHHGPLRQRRRPAFGRVPVAVSPCAERGRRGPHDA